MTAEWPSVSFTHPEKKSVFAFPYPGKVMMSLITGGRMKFALILIALVSFSSFAQSERPLKKILATHSCEMKIMKTPVIFAKEKTRTLSKGLIFTASEWSSSLRRLKVKRAMTIHSITNKHLLMDDASIASVCVLNESTRKCDTNMESLTISQIEEKSGKSVKITCRKDVVTDI